MATVTVSTSQTTSTTKVSSNVHFDPNYFRTIPGLIKVLEAAISLIGFICVMSIPGSSHHSSNEWYSFVSMTGFWISLFVVICYMFHIVEKLHWLPWLVAEMGFAALWSLFFLIAAGVATSNAGPLAAWGAAAFFGYAAVGVFGYEAYLKYTKWKSVDIAQGERQTTTVTSVDIAQGERQTTTVTSSSTTAPSYPTY